ncbi:MAG: hypothetical protein RsTaC01_0779 [Candidatus Paraimprobicoccus trichonymphae]|uniref:Transposase n=1 Tax=Candidatus Paraimprobicoccus trichonymphae TaxID=3033793 RepID=A0AA48L024_9FIRM|nr:MAG: hypothetical protein RsTaC01_0779 [Candidatus Paraimprobicoccus trichonymphae]
MGTYINLNSTFAINNISLFLHKFEINISQMLSIKLKNIMSSIFYKIYINYIFIIIGSVVKKCNIIRMYRKHNIMDRVWKLLETNLKGRKGTRGGNTQDNRRFINAVF